MEGGAPPTAGGGRGVSYGACVKAAGVAFAAGCVVGWFAHRSARRGLEKFFRKNF